MIRRTGNSRTFGQVRDQVARATTTAETATSSNPHDSVEVLPEFRRVEQLVEDGFPLVFVTGSAGTGKSTFIRWLDDRFSGRSILCAPTGIAALTIRGKTIHSLCRFPPAWIVPEDIKLAGRARPMIQMASVLVIDEVSMVNANLLDSIDRFFRLNRGIDSPFGGISVVLVGDLFQLPPIVTNATQHLFRAAYSSPKFFAANCIANSGFEAIELTRAFRQVDQQFVDLLGNIRRGRNLEESVSILNASAFRATEPPEGAVWLCPRNADVERVNSSRLAALPGQVVEFSAMSTGIFRDSQFPVPATIQLKVGAQVVMANNTQHWVNGSIAIVRELGPGEIKVSLIGQNRLLEVKPHEWEQFDYLLNTETGAIERTVVGRYRQLPVNLAWSMTIHKSQGLTLPKVHLDLSTGAFESGQTYVALSRCRQMSDLSLARTIRPEDIKVDPESTSFYSAVFG